MTLTRPWAIDAAFPNAGDQRKQLGGIYPRGGLFPDPVTMAAAGVAQAGVGWAVNAAPFVAAIRRGTAPYSQSYGAALVSNDSLVTGAWMIPSAPISGARLDRLWVRARDVTQADSTAGSPSDGPGGVPRTGLAEFGVTAGEPATSPVLPALPDGVEEIAQVRTPSDAVSVSGSTVTNVYSFAHVVGAPIYIRTFANLAAIVSPAPGEVAILIDGSGEFEYLDTQQATTAGWYQRGSVTRRHRAATQNVNNTVATINYEVVSNNPLVGSDFSYASGTFTCRRTGKYLISAKLSMEAAGLVVGYEYGLRKNGTTIDQARAVTSTTGSTCVNIVQQVDLVRGDTIDSRVYANIAAPGVGADEGYGLTYLQITHLW